MAYGMEQLRKAGDFLNNLDTKYATRVTKDMGGAHKSPLKVMLGGSPMSSIGYDDAQTAKEHAMGIAFTAGVGATNAGYRYGLPAAGLTLAGKGLYDLTAQFGNAEDQPSPTELDPGSAAVGATAGGLTTAGLAGAAYMMGQMDGEDEARRLSMRY